MHAIITGKYAWLPCVLFVAVALQAQDTPERVTVREILGKVEVRRPDNQEWRAARQGMPVRIGWDVRTYVESTVELVFASGTVLKISENSVVTLSNAMVNERAGVSNSKIDVATGKVWANVQKLAGSRSTFDFETPTAVASIRGTVLDLTVGRAGDRINVYEGEVVVRRRGATREVSLVPGQGALIPAEGQEITLVSLATEEAGADSAVVDSTVVDSTGVSPDTTVVPDSAALSEAVVDTVAAGVPDTSAVPAQDSVARLVLRVREPAPGAIVDEPAVIVRGATTPGATVMVGSQEAVVGDDGQFSQVVELKAGANQIAVSASLGEQQRRLEATIEYRPELYLSVSNIVDGMEVTSAQLQLDVEVTPGATFTVNGRAGSGTVELKMGENSIVVRASDRWNTTLEQTYRVLLRPAGRFELNVVTPTDGMVLEEPMIPVSGSTTPGAKVQVRAVTVPVNAAGFFSTRLPLPDEPREYQISIVAVLGDDELSEERTVVYRPRRRPLFLDVTTPPDRHVVTASPLRIQGVTAPGARVSVNGRAVSGLAPTGAFTHTLVVNESMIGEMVLDIQAWYEDDGVNPHEEVSRTVTVTIDVASPQINVSRPRLVVGGLGTQQAVRNCNVVLQVTDMTPDDEIVVEILNNGVRESMTLEPGARENYCFETGKNVFSIQAWDKARNSSPPVTGELYVLPGPVSITVLEPMSEHITVADLPPMPRGVPNPRMTIRVEVEDGIADVPETVRFVRIVETGALLTDHRDYTFSTQVTLGRNKMNTFTLQAEDLAGNRATRQITVDLRQ